MRIPLLHHPDAHCVQSTAPTMPLHAPEKPSETFKQPERAPRMSTLWIRIDRWRLRMGEKIATADCLQ